MIIQLMSELFDVGEINETAVIRKYRITASDGKNYNTRFYNLDAIISNSQGKITQNFFSIVQNKMHYATHGKTAAEVIMERADSTK